MGTTGHRHQSVHQARNGWLLTGIEAVVRIDAYRLDDFLRERFGEDQYEVSYNAGEQWWWIEAPKFLTLVGFLSCTCWLCVSRDWSSQCLVGLLILMQC